MDNHMDNESYWHRSTSSAFNFDDDVSNEDGGGDNASGRAQSGAAADALSGFFFDERNEESSFQNALPAGAIDLSIKHIISDEALKMVLQEQTLDDRVIAKSMPPEEELKLLRRQIQETLYSPSPEATAQKLILGKTAPLEAFKSLQEKQQLLDALLSMGGGDAVTGVVLFLRRTLNKHNFHKILEERPSALRHYLSYLKQCGEHDEAVALLERHEHKTEAFLLRFKSVFDAQDPVQRRERLAHLHQLYIGKPDYADFHQDILCASLKLHERIVQDPTLNPQQANPSPVEVLYVYCQRNKNWKEPPIAPLQFCVEQQISSVQYEWTALNERASAQAYGDLACIFSRVQTWNPLKPKQFHISFSLEVAIQRLHDLNAPSSVLYQFLSEMNNNSEKLALAKNVKCTKAIIDAMAALKQTNELTQLLDTLAVRSEEHFYCENALKALQSKRWTTDSIKLKL